MSYLKEKKFSFVSSAAPLDSETFGVVRFKGTEGFSRCYEFEIDLVSRNADIDITAVLKHPATFTILRKDGDIPFHGILTRFEQCNSIDEYVFYRVVLVPKLWWLSLTHHNQVLLNKKVPEMIEDALKDGGLTTLDFDIKLKKDYPPWEYICQYGESHLNFVSRWMEREGMYFYFEQGDTSEKVIITDTKLSHMDMPAGKTMYYSPPSGLEEFHREEIITTLVCRQKLLPRTLRLKDYNYETPSLEISGQADVSEDGRGDVYIYGEHVRTVKEGNDLAGIRAEEFLCREREFHGESSIPYLRPGYLFDLQDHYRKDVNRSYLTIELYHEGSQAAFLMAGIQKGLSKRDETPYYRNSFVAIPSDVQFRPEKKGEKPHFYGVINARIDAAGSGQYAELDEQGRYKVVLPFDESGRKDGKASAYFRMAQPYAGADHGMHFPLQKGTEVLLTFIDGDPDRPIIAAAVPNPTTVSPVIAANQTSNVIKTSGGNIIVIEDKLGEQHIQLKQSCGNEIILRSRGTNGEIEITDHGKNTILMQGKGGGEFIRVTDHSGNEIFMNGTAGEEKISVTDISGNEVLLDAGGNEAAPQVVITQSCGNKIAMKGKDGEESITITDHGNNQILMNGADGKEGIHIKDKFGNEILMDAVEKYMRLASPSHNSSIELGKSITFNTDSDSKSLISANASFTCLGATSDMFIGVKSGIFVGAKSDISLGESFALNLLFQHAISIALTTSIYLGAQVDLRFGPRVENETAPAIKMSTLSLGKKALSIVFGGIHMLG